jgi:hypothetical protein
MSCVLVIGNKSIHVHPYILDRMNLERAVKQGNRYILKNENHLSLFLKMLNILYGYKFSLASWMEVLELEQLIQDYDVKGIMDNVAINLLHLVCQSDSVEEALSRWIEKKASKCLVLICFQILARSPQRLALFKETSLFENISGSFDLYRATNVALLDMLGSHNSAGDTYLSYTQSLYSESSSDFAIQFRDPDSKAPVARFGIHRPIVTQHSDFLKVALLQTITAKNSLIDCKKENLECLFIEDITPKFVPILRNAFYNECSGIGKLNHIEELCQLATVLHQYGVYCAEKVCLTRILSLATSGDAELVLQYSRYWGEESKSLTRDFYGEMLDYKQWYNLFMRSYETLLEATLEYPKKRVREELETNEDEQASKEPRN